MRTHFPLFVLSLVVTLFLSPTPLSAQPPPPPPPPPPPSQPQLPSAVWHGWNINGLASDPNSPRSYLLDSRYQIVQLNTTSGQPTNAHAFDAYSHFLHDLTVDQQGRVLATGNVAGLGLALLVLDSDLHTIRNLSLSTLKPALLYATRVEVVTDSNGFIYLSTGLSHTSAVNVWVVDGEQMVQVDWWQPSLPIFTYGSVNYTDYLMAIDSTDTLYFQQTAHRGQTFSTDTGGAAVATFDTYGGRAFTDLTRIVAFAVDSQSTLLTVRRDSLAIDRLATSGPSPQRLSPLYVLTDAGHPLLPQLATSFTNGLTLVSDPVSSSVLLVNADGFIRTISAPHATASTSDADEMGIDPNSGDLLMRSTDPRMIAQRINSRDGSLIQEYEWPLWRARDDWVGCRVEGMDVGERTGLLYAVLFCLQFGPDISLITTMRLHALYPSGRVHSEVILPIAFRQVRLRVDEWEQRLYISHFRFSFTDAHTEIFVLSLNDGRLLNTIAPSNPRLGLFIEMDLRPTPHGTELVVVDVTQQRLLFLANNGTLLEDRPVDSERHLDGVVFMESGDVFVSSSQWVDGRGVGNSCIVQLTRSGEVVARYVVKGSGRDNAQFDMITVSEHGLFAFDQRYSTVFRWDLRPRLDHQKEQSEGEEEEVNVVDVKTRVWDRVPTVMSRTTREGCRTQLRGGAEVEQ